jgi:thioredoxin-related protein
MRYALTVLVTACGSVSAQEVQWRHDYAAARKESAATGRPLLLDFGSDNCVWCQRLDASTFRNPKVIALLNEQFIPVKLDGNREEPLTQALNVTGFPTLVLAAPDGRVLGRKDGYLDAAGMTAMLRQAAAKAKSAAPAPPPKSATADDLAAAHEDYDAGRFLACLERCRKVRTSCAGTADADEAGKLAARVAADPAAWRRACDEIAARLDEVRPALPTR